MELIAHHLSSRQPGPLVKYENITLMKILLIPVDSAYINCTLPPRSRLLEREILLHRLEIALLTVNNDKWQYWMQTDAVLQLNKRLTFRALLNNSAGHIRSSCSMSDQLFIFIGERPRVVYVVRFITVLINSCTSTKPFVSKCRSEYLCFLLIFVIIYSWIENIIKIQFYPENKLMWKKLLTFRK